MTVRGGSAEFAAQGILVAEAAESMRLDGGEQLDDSVGGISDR